MAKNTVDWFAMREKYYSLTDKPRLISQIRPNEHAAKPSPDLGTGLGNRPAAAASGAGNGRTCRQDAISFT